MLVQREIAERLRADPGTREYGSPSVLAQLACEVTLERTVDPAVFTPRPRVELGAAAPPQARARRAGGAAGARPRRRSPTAASRWRARSSWREPGRLDAARAALERIGKPADARAEALSPAEFKALWELLS